MKNKILTITIITSTILMISAIIIKIHYSLKGINSYIEYHYHI